MSCYTLEKAQGRHVFGAFAVDGVGYCSHLNDADNNQCKDVKSNYTKFVDLTGTRNALGFIPLCGQIIACDRFIENTCYCCSGSYCNRPIQEKSYYQANCCRGLAEMLCFGFVPCIIDCFVCLWESNQDPSRGLLKSNLDNPLLSLSMNRI